ncbi:MAG: hypothetical protein ACFB16_15175 [Phormidesmis sp.]
MVATKTQMSLKDFLYFDDGTDTLYALETYALENGELMAITRE